MDRIHWTMIARVYGRWMPSADVEAGEKAEVMWSTVKSDKDATHGGTKHGKTHETWSR